MIDQREDDDDPVCVPVRYRYGRFISLPLSLAARSEDETDRIPGSSVLREVRFGRRAAGGARDGEFSRGGRFSKQGKARLTRHGRKILTQSLETPYDTSIR